MHNPSLWCANGIDQLVLELRPEPVEPQAEAMA